LHRLVSLVDWVYIVTCNKCGYISAEKLEEVKAKELLASHLSAPNGCTRGHVKLVKVRAWWISFPRHSFTKPYAIYRSIL